MDERGQSDNPISLKCIFRYQTQMISCGCIRYSGYGLKDVLMHWFFSCIVVGIRILEDLKLAFLQYWSRNTMPIKWTSEYNVDPGGLFVYVISDISNKADLEDHPDNPIQFSSAFFPEFYPMPFKVKSWCTHSNHGCLLSLNWKQVDVPFKVDSGPDVAKISVF